MSDISAWSHFFDEQAQRSPLRFVGGGHHPVYVGTYYGTHAHKSLELVFHPIGRGETRIEEDVLSFEEGSVLIHPPHQRHDQTMHKSGEDRCLFFNPSSGGPDFPRDCLYLPQIGDSGILEEIRVLSEVRAPVSPFEQPVMNLRATAVMLSLVHFARTSWISKNAPRAERSILKAETYIREHLSEIKQLGEVAEAVSLSPDRLRHLFKELRGESVIRYVNKMRIERSKSLLVHSHVPLKQIAGLCGYKDEYYFSAVFHKFTQTSPGQYRQVHR